MVKERALDPQIRHDQYAIRDEYRRALGLYADTELGAAALRSFSEGGERAEATATKPRPFAEQTVHNPRRSRKRKTVNEAFAKALAHLGEPAGNA
jgi:hypothetical protein